MLHVTVQFYLCLGLNCLLCVLNFLLQISAFVETGSKRASAPPKNIAFLKQKTIKQGLGFAGLAGAFTCYEGCKSIKKQTT